MMGWLRNKLRLFVDTFQTRTSWQVDSSSGPWRDKAKWTELDVLRRLPAGTLVDGELVAFDADGRPDLRRLLRRHGLTNAWRIRQARHWCRVRYVLFDLLYHAGRCLLREPLARRREVLAEVCQRLDASDVQFSVGVIGTGTAFYQAAVALGHEGVMAKHLGSTYRPGRRCTTWRKIKPRPKRTCSLIASY